MCNWHDNHADHICTPDSKSEAADLLKVSKPTAVSQSLQCSAPWLDLCSLRGARQSSHPISISEGCPWPLASPVPTKGAADVQVTEEEPVLETQHVVVQTSARPTKSNATFTCTNQEHVQLLRGIWARRLMYKRTKLCPPRVHQEGLFPVLWLFVKIKNKSVCSLLTASSPLFPVSLSQRPLIAKVFQRQTFLF